MPNIEVRRDEANGKIWSHVRSKWLVETPEETVRQTYLLVLTNEYGFHVDQIGEELQLIGRGSAGARADFVIWRTSQDKVDNKAPFIVVECKSDNVTIKPVDYSQGETYSRICDAPFFVTHNSRETRYWRVKKDMVPGYTEEIENIPHPILATQRLRNCYPNFAYSKKKSSRTSCIHATTQFETLK